MEATERAGPVQSRPADVVPAVAGRPRPAVHARALSSIARRRVIAAARCPAHGPDRVGQERARAGARRALRRSRSSASIRRRSIAAWTSAPPSPTPPTRARVAHHLIDIDRSRPSVFGGALSRRRAGRDRGDPRPRAHSACWSAARCCTSRRCAKACRVLPRADAAVRDELDARAAREGWPALHAELARVDPATAARLAAHRCAAHPARARSASPDRRRRCRRCRARAKRGRRAADFVAVALVPADRAELHRRDRDALRRDARRRAGRRVARAAHALSRSTPSMPSMRCVGYRQAWEFLDGRSTRRAIRANAASPPRGSSPSAS